MPLRLRLKRTHRYEVAARGFFVLPVHLPQATPLDCTVTSASTGRECLNFVASRLELIDDICFFGLRYYSTDPDTSIRWLALDRPVKKQLDRHAKEQALHLGIMFYTDKAINIVDDRARELYFSALKQEVLFGEAHGISLDRALMLAAYSLQAEYGPWESGAPQSNVEFLRRYRHLPESLMPTSASQYDDIVNQLVSNYHSLIELTPSQAQELYIDMVQGSDGFGVYRFPCVFSTGGKKKSDVEHVILGVSRDGVQVENCTPGASSIAITSISWNDIKSFSHRGKSFTLQKCDKSRVLTFQFTNDSLARYVWDFLAQLHDFYVQFWSRGGVSGGVRPGGPLPAPDLLAQPPKPQALARSDNSSSTCSGTPDSPPPPHQQLSSSLQDLSLLPSYRQVPDYDTIMQHRQFYQHQKQQSLVSSETSAGGKAAVADYLSYLSSHLYDNLPASSAAAPVTRPPRHTPDVALQAQQAHHARIAAAISVPDIHSLMQRLNGKETQFSASLLQDFSQSQQNQQAAALLARQQSAGGALHHRSTPNLSTRDLYADYANAEVLLSALRGRPESTCSVESSATFKVHAHREEQLVESTESPYEDVVVRQCSPAERAALTVSYANLLWAESEQRAEAEESENSATSMSPQRIPRDDRRQALENKLSSGNLAAELSAIPSRDSSKNCLAGSSAENTHRNFNSEILPYDETRVKLRPTAANPSGYINASHVRVRVRGRQMSHIAAQSPHNESTVWELWRMVWQQEVRVLAQLEERPVKYWPREVGPTGAMTFQGLTVTLRRPPQLSPSGSYSTACLRLDDRTVISQKREVWLFLYHSWSDEDVPQESSDFLSFLDEVDSLNRHLAGEGERGDVHSPAQVSGEPGESASNHSSSENSTPPVLFHCSLGVGRTGVAICLQIMKACLEHNQDLSVPTILCTLRGYRMSLVQSLAQYICLYKSLILFLRNTRLI